MSQLFDFAGVGDYCTGGLLYPNPKKHSFFPTHGNPVDAFLAPRKRSRVYAPYIVSGETKKKPSIEVLPDECLFEIFRRLSTGQERNACAGVSKRWLMLLSNITKDESCSKTTQNEVGEKKEEDESTGYLSRSLEGKKATDVRLAAIAVGTASRGGLGKLSIRGSSSTRGLTNSGLKAISRSCPALRILSLWNLSSVGDEGLCEIAKGVHSLEKLDLSHCSAVTDKSLIAVAMNSPNLTSVTIESCVKVGNESLQALGKYCPNLRSVTVKNCPLIGDQGISSLLSSAGHVLTTVKFQSLNISDVSLAVIGHYGKAMTDLALVGLANVNERGFWVMGKGQELQKLKSLSITDCAGVSDLGIASLANGCPDLKQFALKKCQLVSDNGVASFVKAVVSLESLQLEECHRITQYGIFAVLANCAEKLKALAVVNCLGIRDLEFGFQVTSLCPSLRSLTIQNCPGFGDANLAMLGKLCPNLTHVNLTGLKGITDSGLLPLVHNSVSGLEKVNMTGCANLTDKVVNAIVNLHGETLVVLNLDGCEKISDMSMMAIAKSCWVLSELDVSKSAITDYGISVLAGSQQLHMQIFSIAGCDLVSDKSLPFLKLLGRTLIGLNIQKCCGISSGSIDQLLEQLWRCDILY